MQGCAPPRGLKSVSFSTAPPVGPTWHVRAKKSAPAGRAEAPSNAAAISQRPEGNDDIMAAPPA